MSDGKGGEADNTSCASCGIAEVDDIKLKDCDDCDLVRYCSDECKENHKTEHEEACKKRAAELRDELLFKQPESSHRGDCPICCVPLPLDETKSFMYNCCSKIICSGCCYTNQKREWEASLRQSCAFCREPAPKTEEEAEKQRMKRIEANDPAAMRQHANLQYFKGDYQSALELCLKAAELGDAGAHYRLSGMYRRGHGVEIDEGKEIHHLEEAAIGGHPFARCMLGAIEWNNNINPERAVKHWIISATQGEDNSIKELMKIFKLGQNFNIELYLSKDDLAATLRAHRAAVNATKSPQRKVAEDKMGRNG